MDWQCAQISNMNGPRREPLQIQKSGMIELLQKFKKLDGFRIRGIIKYNKNLQFIRGLLTWNKTRNLPQLMEMLTHPILASTSVSDKLEQFARHLTSSHKIYTRKNLDIPKTARIADRILDTVAGESECERLIRRFLTRLKFEDLVGAQNLDVLVGWIVNVMYGRGRKNDVFPNIDFKTAPLARCFKTKQVCQKIPHQGDKRALQIYTIKNVVSIAAFAVFYKLHTQFIYIKHEKKMVNCWKIGAQKFVTKEKRAFMRQYCLKKLSSERATLPSIKFKISKKSLRPIYFAPKRHNWTNHHFFQEVNSVLEFICQQQGVKFEQIRPIFFDLRRFLVRKMKQFVDLRQMRLQTIDIHKCFASIDHQKLLDILEKWTPDGFIFIQIGWAKTINLFGPNQVPLRWRLCATSSTEIDAKNALSLKAHRKQAEIYELKDVKIFTKAEILSTIGNVLNGFGVRIAKGDYQVTKGVPQGHALSPNLANIYLADFERKHWSDLLKSDKIFIGRYVDDFIICATDQTQIDALYSHLIIENHHGLRAKNAKSKFSQRGSEILWCGKTIEFYKMASLVGRYMREQGRIRLI